MLISYMWWCQKSYIVAILVHIIACKQNSKMFYIILPRWFGTYFMWFTLAYSGLQTRLFLTKRMGRQCWEEKWILPQSKSIMVLAKETHKEIDITQVRIYLYNAFSNSWTCLSCYSQTFLVKISGVNFFEWELSQDPMENFFGHQRQRGWTSENPTV